MAIRIRQVVVSVAFSAMVAGLAALPMTASAQPPITMESERLAHPELVEAIRKCEEAYGLLQTGSGNFGGNKVTAQNDLRQALHSMRKALYYRLNLDDAAIDRLH